jgi:hypothetical protein
VDHGSADLLQSPSGCDSVDNPPGKEKLLLLTHSIGLTRSGKPQERKFLGMYDEMVVAGLESEKGHVMGARRKSLVIIGSCLKSILNGWDLAGKRKQEKNHET